MWSFATQRLQPLSLSPEEDCQSPPLAGLCVDSLGKISPPVGTEWPLGVCFVSGLALQWPVLAH